mgnify:CR=1 FL=1
MTSSVPAIEYRGVTYRYPRAGTDAVRNVSLVVAAGERLGVLGPNGGGKSTLLKLTLGLLPMQTGEIRVFGRSVDEAKREHLIGYVPQKSKAELGFPLSVRQVVEMSPSAGLAPWRRLAATQRARVDEAMEAVDVTAIADRHIGSLSGGQFQRVMIARALAGGPRLLLLDEPTVGIDVAGQLQFGRLLETLHARLGLSMVVVSHDLRAIAAGCDRIACLSRGLHSHTSPEGLTPAVLAEVFRHDVGAIFGDLHIDAHSAAACTDPSHSHAVKDQGPIGLTIEGRGAGERSPPPPPGTKGAIR